MAEIWPDEGLDVLLGLFRGDSFPTLSLRLFTSFSATTVGTASQTASAYTEPSGGSYAGVAIATSDWGAQGAMTTPITGRKITLAQKTFPTATADWGQVNGFWIRTAGGVCLYAANFDEGAAIVLNGETLKVTPFLGMGN